MIGEKMQQSNVVDWLLRSIGLDTYMTSTTVKATRRGGDELLLTTDDGEYVQTWIVSVRPTVRVCEVAGAVKCSTCEYTWVEEGDPCPCPKCRGDKAQDVVG